jgi:hypothetical protein
MEERNHTKSKSSIKISVIFEQNSLLPTFGRLSNFSFRQTKSERGMPNGRTREVIWLPNHISTLSKMHSVCQLHQQNTTPILCVFSGLRCPSFAILLRGFSNSFQGFSIFSVRSPVHDLRTDPRARSLCWNRILSLFSENSPELPCWARSNHFVCLLDSFFNERS